MPTYTIRAKDLRGIEKELTTLFNKHNRQRAARIKQAVAKTARIGKAYIERTTIPIAFSELVDSLAAHAASIVATAPHAEAVELGARPHTPPLAPLIKWVRLRGMQGLTKTGTLKRGKRGLKGTTTREHARSIAKLIRAQRRGAKGASYTPLDAIEQIARAIQFAISKRGTKPHRFMQKAIPFVARTLHDQVAAAVPDK